MITALETYMDALYTGMYPMPNEERLRIVRETAQRIKERAARLQMSEENLLKDMESPQETARKFLSRWQSQQAPMERPAKQPEPETAPEAPAPGYKPKAGMGIAKVLLMVFLLPVLFPLLILPVVFVVLGVLLPVVGVLSAVTSLLGLPFAHMYVLGMNAPPVVGLALNILAGVMLFKLGRHLLRKLRPYLRGVRRAD